MSISYAVFCLKKKMATDAPLLSKQIARLCTRAALGVGRGVRARRWGRGRDLRRDPWGSGARPVFVLVARGPQRSTLFPYTTLFRSRVTVLSRRRRPGHGCRLDRARRRSFDAGGAERR